LKAFRPEAPPEFRALATAFAPLIFKERKMLIERARTRSEDVGPLAPDNRKALAFLRLASMRLMLKQLCNQP
jgi:hypothetical protein